MQLRDFKEMVHKRSSPPASAILRKDAAIAVQQAGARRAKFTLSTGAVDRDNDRIAVAGWDLRAYARNPVVLFNHDGFSPPIGKCIEIGIEGGRLKAVVEFAPRDMPCGVGEQAELMWRMCSGGFLSACSVGFRPLEWTTAKDRMTGDDWSPAIDFQRQELMEWSVVTIPANGEATIDSARRTAPPASTRRLSQRSI